MTVENDIFQECASELEIIEFQLQDNKFGINVIQVREIIQPVPVTFIPHAHQYIEGIIQLRGEVLPVVDLAKVLNTGTSEDKDQEKYIVAEFNQVKVVFHVHNVSQIHRISREQIEKPSDMYAGQEHQVIGVIKQENDMILILDFESIIAEINHDADNKG